MKENKARDKSPLIVIKNFDIEDFKNEIARKVICKWDLKQATIQAVEKQLYKSPELLEKIMKEATEKAIKNIAKWKLLRDGVDLEIQVMRCLRKIQHER